MSADETGVGMDPFRRNFVVVAVFVMAAIGVGYFLAWDSGDAGHLLRWFWIGIAVTIVYLLYRIAGSLEKLRVEG